MDGKEDQDMILLASSNKDKEILEGQDDQGRMLSATSNKDQERSR